MKGEGNWECSGSKNVGFNRGTGFWPARNPFRVGGSIKITHVTEALRALFHFRFRLFRGGFHQREAQLVQLGLVDAARCVEHHVAAGVVLREGDVVADRIRAAEQRTQPVEAEGETAVRGRAELEGVHQEAEAHLSLFGREARLFVNGAFGEVAFGRMGTLGSANGTYGILGNLSPFGASWVGAVEYSTYYVGGIRADNTVTYKTPTFAGVTVYAQYSFETNTKQEENLKATEGKASANRYYALGATYKAAGFDLAAVVDSYNWSSTFTKKDADLDDGLSVTLGGSYDFKVAKVFLSGQYFDNMIGNDKSGTETADAGKSDSFYSFSSYFGNQNPIEGYALQAGVSAPVAGGTAMFAVGYTDAEEANSEANKEKIEFKRIGTSVGYTYSLSKRTNLYGVAAYYRDSLKNEKNVAGDDRDPSTVTVYAGIRHTF